LPEEVMLLIDAIEGWPAFRCGQIFFSFAVDPSN
jgi:hypothetical protein